MSEAESRSVPVSEALASARAARADRAARIPAGAVVAAALAPVVVAGAGAGPGADASAVKPVVTLLDASALHPLEAPLGPDAVGPGASPQVAPGIVLALAAAVPGPGATPGAVLAATTAVHGALAVHEAGTVTRLVVGRTGVAPTGLDLGLIGVLFERDGVQLGTAAGAASFGHPAAAAAAAADTLATGTAGALATAGRPGAPGEDVADSGLGPGPGDSGLGGSEHGGPGLAAGWLVWCGALLPPADLPPGSHIRAAFGHLGVVTLRRP